MAYIIMGVIGAKVRAAARLCASPRPQRGTQTNSWSGLGITRRLLCSSCVVMTCFLSGVAIYYPTRNYIGVSREGQAGHRHQHWLDTSSIAMNADPLGYGFRGLLFCC